MVGHGGSSAGSYLADPTSPIPSHCASIVVTSTLKSLYAYNEYSGRIQLCVFPKLRHYLENSWQGVWDWDYEVVSDIQVLDTHGNIT